MSDFKKLKLQLRGYLTGAAIADPSYLIPIKALNLAETWHTGVRKDGVTPEFQHQIEITQYIRTLAPLLKYPSLTLAAALLHDLYEDYSSHVTLDYIAQHTSNDVSLAVELLSKKNSTYVKDIFKYFENLAKCPISSVVKGVDRIHNLQTMVGVFTIEKQIKYIEEVEVYFLPMLKKAKRNFPEQEAVYENIKFVLTNYIRLIKSMHAVNESNK